MHRGRMKQSTASVIVTVRNRNVDTRTACQSKPTVIDIPASVASIEWAWCINSLKATAGEIGLWAISPASPMNSPNAMNGITGLLNLRTPSTTTPIPSAKNPATIMRLFGVFCAPS